MLSLHLPQAQHASSSRVSCKKNLRYQLLDSIVDYKQDGTAIHRNDLYINTKSDQKRMRQTTAGWNLLVNRHGTQEWIPLKVLKNSNPIEVAEFVVARGLDKEPAFICWVPHTLRRRDRIIAGVNS